MNEGGGEVYKSQYRFGDCQNIISHIEEGVYLMD